MFSTGYHICVPVIVLDPSPFSRIFAIFPSVRWIDSESTVAKDVNKLRMPYVTTRVLGDTVARAFEVQ